jgi:hypothetical protein
MARFVVVAPRETIMLVVEAKVRTLQMDDVPLPETTKSFAKVYVPDPPKVPGWVVMTPVPEV